ncbi:MAG: endolytic transglycosylase MltG [Ignavibacteriales bacterium]|nr:endolytic transglycosylase MltG [Ignavibacteriales bacterium]
MRSKTSYKNLLTTRQLIYVLSVFAMVLAILIYTFFSPNKCGRPLPVNITIKPGMNYTTIAEILFQNKLIPSKINFRIAGMLLGATEKVRAGRYTITGNFSYLGLTEYLLYGQANRVRLVKIYDGATVRAITARLHQDKIVNKDLFQKFLRSDSSKKAYHLPASGFEGYLFPGSYLFYENSSPAEIVDSMITKLYKGLPDSLIKQVDKSNKLLHQVLTLASIVEGETNRTSEMDCIAGVYVNRLRIGMKLQADPTVQYLRTGGWSRVKGDILKTDSPYNTYRYYGLPPGPINNPGIHAINAAFSPEKHKYLFFAADTNGNHLFAANYSQHRVNARKYYKWLNARELRQKEKAN